MQLPSSVCAFSQETQDLADGSSDSAAVQALHAQLRAKTLECEERAHAGQAQADELDAVRQEARQALARLQVVSRSLEDAHTLLHTEQSKYEALKVVFDVQQRALDDAQAMMLSVRSHLKGLAHDNDALQRKVLQDELRMNALSSQNSQLLDGMRMQRAASGRSGSPRRDEARPDARLPHVLKALVSPGRQPTPPLGALSAAFDHAGVPPPQSIAPSTAAVLDAPRSWQDALQELLHARLPGQDSPTRQHHARAREHSFPAASATGHRGLSEAVAGDLQLTELLGKVTAQQGGAAQLSSLRAATPPPFAGGCLNSGGGMHEPPSTSSLLSDSVLATLANAHAPAPARGGLGRQDGDLHALLSDLITGLRGKNGRSETRRGVDLGAYALQVLLAADAGPAGTWAQEMARAAGPEAAALAERFQPPVHGGSAVAGRQAPVLSNATEDHASDLSDESHTVKSTQINLKRTASDSTQSPAEKRARLEWHPDEQLLDRERLLSANALEMLVEAAFHAPRVQSSVSPPSSGAGSPKANRHLPHPPAPVPGKHGRRINPRKGIPMHVMATHSLLRLPNHRGNLGEIAAEIEKNELFRSHLDWTPRPGTKTYPRWKDALVGCFKPHRYPHLMKTDQRKEGLTVYALDESKIPQKSRLSQAMLKPGMNTSAAVALTRHALLQPV